MELTDARRHLEKLDDNVLAQSKLAAEQLSRLRGPMISSLSTAATTLASSTSESVEPTRQIEVLKDVVERSESKFGPNEIVTLNFRGHLASTYSVVGKFDAAIDLCQESLRRAIVNCGPQHLVVTELRADLVQAYRAAGRAAAAIASLQDAIELVSLRFGDNSRERSYSAVSLARPSWRMTDPTRRSRYLKL